MEWPGWLAIYRRVITEKLFIISLVNSETAKVRNSLLNRPKLPRNSGARSPVDHTPRHQYPPCDNPVLHLSAPKRASRLKPQLKFRSRSAEAAKSAAWDPIPDRIFSPAGSASEEAGCATAVFEQQADASPKTASGCQPQTGGLPRAKQAELTRCVVEGCGAKFRQLFQNSSWTKVFRRFRPRRAHNMKSTLVEEFGQKKTYLVTFRKQFEQFGRTISLFLTRSAETSAALFEISSGAVTIQDPTLNNHKSWFKVWKLQLRTMFSPCEKSQFLMIYRT